ncbi:MAG TPA: hypothetical protein VFN23_14670 [Ktedonobacteraceae bacterium]|nr:hypothetical protein [Ktedonobacteraceae bacterium]
MQYSDLNKRREEQTRGAIDAYQVPTSSFPDGISTASGDLAVPHVRPTHISTFGPQHELNDQKSSITLHVLLRQTGLGIKVRFLVALILIAIIPATVLVFLLGDPSGQEQHASLGQALHMQAQGQAAALNQTFAARQYIVATLAGKPLFSQILAGSADPTSGRTILQTAQQSDSSSIAWYLVNSNGIILVSGDAQNQVTPQQLAQTKAVSQPDQLIPFVQNLAKGQTSNATLLNDDPHLAGGWVALAARVSPRSSGVLLAIFSLKKVTQGLVAPTNTLPGQVSLLLDAQNRIVASAGPLAAGVRLFGTVPQSVQVPPPGPVISGTVNSDPLTGQNDVVVATPVSALKGQYLLLIPQETPLVLSNRMYFAGRNTYLLLLAIIVIVVLVATWVALPIIQPIRRATRAIGNTTEEVRRLAIDARRIAKDHSLGTAILSGTNRKLLSRRQGIIRDAQLIIQTCDAILPRLQSVLSLAHGSANWQAVEALQVVVQGLEQVKEMANVMGTTWEKDNSLTQLDSAMKSAHEISEQFMDAGHQLERDAENLEEAARTLL